MDDKQKRRDTRKVMLASDGPFRYGRVRVVRPSVSAGEVGRGLGR